MSIGWHEQGLKQGGYRIGSYAVIISWHVSYGVNIHPFPPFLENRLHW